MSAEASKTEEHARRGPGRARVGGAVVICGASIAKRDGTHRRCLLPDQHLDECSPIAIVRASPWRPPAAASEQRELAIIAGVHFALVLVVLAVLWWPR